MRSARILKEILTHVYSILIAGVLALLILAVAASAYPAKSHSLAYTDSVNDWLATKRDKTGRLCCVGYIKDRLGNHVMGKDGKPTLGDCRPTSVRNVAGADGSIRSEILVYGRWQALPEDKVIDTHGDPSPDGNHWVCAQQHSADEDVFSGSSPRHQSLVPNPLGQGRVVGDHHIYCIMLNGGS